MALSIVSLGLSACDQPSPILGAGMQAAPVQGAAFPASVLDYLAGGGDANGPFRGKLIVLNIWATWCPPCRREMPGLDRLSRKLDPKRFAVVGLSVDKDTLLAAEFLVQHGISFANIFDQSGKMTRSLGVNVYPETFVIAPDRRILLRVSGQREWDSPEMISMLEEIQKL
jgi:thiol-disulfide isomerase/thioredoxin